MKSLKLAWSSSDNWIISLRSIWLEHKHPTFHWKHSVILGNSIPWPCLPVDWSLTWVWRSLRHPVRSWNIWISPSALNWRTMLFVRWLSAVNIWQRWMSARVHYWPIWAYSISVVSVNIYTKSTCPIVRWSPTKERNIYDATVSIWNEWYWSNARISLVPPSINCSRLFLTFNFNSWSKRPIDTCDWNVWLTCVCVF